MAELTTLARPYAKAAFQAASAAGQLQPWSGMLTFLAQLAAEPALQALLSHPALTSEAKAKVVIEVAGDKLTEAGQNFVHILAENKRLALLPEISELFEKLKSQQEQTIDVMVETAFEISEAEKTGLAQALSRKLSRTVNVSTQANRDLIGGVVVRADDLVIDASVRGKLTRLAESMNS